MTSVPLHALAPRNYNRSEVASQVLLNLALSANSSSAVQQDSRLIAAMTAAAADQANLTKLTAHFLGETKFQLDVVLGRGKTGVQRHHKAISSKTPGYIMLSYCWAQQETVVRVRDALGRRGYAVWLDIEQMQGSTVEAMADAIDGCSAVLYGISRNYKESANCKLELSYAHSMGIKMVPMMLQSDYTPQGWLGMILGLDLWYGFYGDVLDDEALFETKIGELCRALGPAPTRSQAGVAAAQAAGQQTRSGAPDATAHASGIGVEQRRKARWSEGNVPPAAVPMREGVESAYRTSRHFQLEASVAMLQQQVARLEATAASAQSTQDSLKELKTAVVLSGLGVTLGT